MPASELVLVVEPSLNLDHGCRPEIGPGKLLSAGPAQGNPMARRLRPTGCLDAGLARVFAAEAAAEIRHDDAHLLVAQMKGARQLRPAAERVLCAGPDGELAVGPFGDRGARFQRRVLDVGDMVGLLEGVLGMR